MLEIVFSESAGGSLKVAKSLNKAGTADGATAVFLRSGDGGRPSAEEWTAAQREAEEELRRARERAVPMEGGPEDVYCLSLALDMGDIAKDAFFERRSRFFRSLWSIYPEPPQAEEYVSGVRAQLEKLLALAVRGEPLRIWFSSAPDEFCGLCWLASRLAALPELPAPVYLLRLPEWEPGPDGKSVLRRVSWGDVAPEDWGRSVPRQEEASPPLLRHLAQIWNELQEENAPLRAVLNGKPVSVPEDFYDAFLLRELARMDGELHEGRLIGRVLGRYSLGIGDALLAARVEAFVRVGKLAPVTGPDADAPRYHRMLRKLEQL